MKLLTCDDGKAFLDSRSSYVEAYIQNHGIACEIAATTDSKSAMGLGNVFDLVILNIQGNDILYNIREEAFRKFGFTYLGGRQS